MGRTIDWSTFIHKVGDTTVIVPCMTFVMFLELTDDKTLSDFYSRCREALGDRITHYEAESMNGFSKLSARANAMVPTWLTQPRKGKLIYYMYMADGDPNHEITGAQVELAIFRRPASEWTGEAKDKELARQQKAYEEKRILAPRPASKLRVTLPLDHPLAEPGRFAEWIAEFEIVRGDLPFSGYGGLAVNFFRQPVRASVYESTQRLLTALLLQHPGFDWEGGGVLPRLIVYRPEPQGFRMLTKRVNWINLLSEQVVKDLGGKADLRARLEREPTATVREVGRGFLVLAGQEPQAGDIARGDFVPSYRHVERILRPGRIDDIDGLGGIFYTPQANEWLNAFLDDGSPCKRQ